MWCNFVLLACCAPLLAASFTEYDQERRQSSPGQDGIVPENTERPTPEDFGGHAPNTSLEEHDPGVESWEKQNLREILKNNPQTKSYIQHLRRQAANPHSSLTPGEKTLLDLFLPFLEDSNAEENC